MFLKTLIKQLETIAPLSLQEPWDRSGLQFGSKLQKVKKIVFAIDLTMAVFDFALKENADMIITHHPFLFEETEEENFLNAPYKKHLMERIKNTKMIVYIMHTNFDKAKLGMPLALCNKIKLKPKNIPGVSFGSGFYFDKTTTYLLKHINNVFNFEVVNHNINNLENKINSFAFLPGSAPDADIIEASKNFPVVITSDIKWNMWITAQEMKINLIEVPHLVEDMFAKHMANYCLNRLKIEIAIYKQKELKKKI